MKALLFQRNGVQTDGYLPGVPSYAQGVRLVSAELTCRRWPPVAGALRLELEVDRALTGLAFTVPPEEGELRQSLPLGALVPAGAVIRWRASFGGAADDGATDLAVTVAVAPAVNLPEHAALVVWTDGSAQVALYAFTGGVYRALRPGRASVTPDGSEIRVDGAVRCSASSEGLQAAGWREGSLAMMPPRLEFWLGSECVGVMAPNGCFVAHQLTEGMPAGAGFTFASGGAVVAVLGTSGLTATALTES